MRSNSSQYQKLVAIGIFVVVTVSSFVLTSGEYLFLKLKVHPELAILFIGGGLLAMLLLLRYQRRMVQYLAWLFPIILLGATAFNLAEDKVGWTLQQQSSNSFFTLARTSGSRNTIYVYVHEYFQNWTLVTTPETLAASGLTERELLYLGKLDVVEYWPDHKLPNISALNAFMYNSQLTEIQVKEQFIMVSPNVSLHVDEPMLVLVPFQEEFILVPRDMISSRGTSQ